MKHKTTPQNFMSMSKPDMLKVLQELEANYKKMIAEANAIANLESFGRATSILIHSLEESMKYIILLMDYNGFKFRQKVPAIKNLFYNHTLRYALGSSISILYLFMVDLKKAISFFMKMDHNEINTSEKRKAYIKSKEGALMNWIVAFLANMEKEFEWYSKAEFLRQEGFYVDVSQGIKSPFDLTKTDYEDVKFRIEGVHSFISDMKESFTGVAKHNLEHMKKLRKSFIEEGWYTKMNVLIKDTDFRKTNPMLVISREIGEIKKDIANNGLKLE